MNTLETLGLETMQTDGDSIKSLFSANLSRHLAQPTPSLESSGVMSLFKKVTGAIDFTPVGSYSLNYVSEFRTQKTWLEVKEIVIDSPVTFAQTDVATLFGHILKSKSALEGLEQTLHDFAGYIAHLTSDPSSLGALSGVRESIDPKTQGMYGVAALRKMVDINKPSRVKLGRLFHSVSDMNVAVKLSNETNQVLSGLNLSKLNERVERIVELTEILVQDVDSQASKMSIAALIKDTGTLAGIVSDMTYLVSVVDQVSRTLNTIHDSLD